MAKTCICGCGKGVFSKGLALNCWKRVYQKPIKKVSIKEQARKEMYGPLAKAFLNKHKMCGARLPACTVLSTEVHHMEGRIGDLLLDTAKWLPLCHNCHATITDDSAMAVERGFSLKRNNKK